MLVAWMASGPPRENERVLAGITFYESEIAGRYLLGCSTKDDPPAAYLCRVTMIVDPAATA